MQTQTKAEHNQLLVKYKSSSGSHIGSRCCFYRYSHSRQAGRCDGLLHLGQFGLLLLIADGYEAGLLLLCRLAFVVRIGLQLVRV